MTVRAYGADDALLGEWIGPAFFYGPLPVQYVGEGPPWHWDSPDAATIKVGSNAQGDRGKTLVAWAPRGSRRILVEVVARGRGARSGGHLAGHARGAPDGHVHGHEDGTDLAHAGRGTPLAAGPEDEPRGGQSTRGRDHARPWGHARGSEEPSWAPGGIPGVDGGRIGDREHGKDWGRPGGKPGAHGHVDGAGIWGLLDVPAEIASAVNVAVILADANITGAGQKLLRHAVEGVARKALRAHIATAAEGAARAGRARVIERLDTLDAYKHLPRAERQALLARAEHAMARAFRRRLARHAAQKADEYERLLAELADQSSDQAEHLRKIARENIGGYRKVESAALAGDIRPTGTLGGKPGGTRTIVEGSPDNRRGLMRENETADTLAARGYRVEQNTVTNAHKLAEEIKISSLPDYSIEGKIFDNYAPAPNTPLERIRDSISKKIKKGQTRNIVVNLNDTQTTPDELKHLLTERKPVPELETVIIVKGKDATVMIP